MVALLDANAQTDWYVFVDTKRTTAEVAAIVETILSQRGQRSEAPLDELRRDRKILFMSSGTLDHIMDDLETLGESQRELRAKIQLN